MSHKHSHLIISIVSTIITFVFFLGFIYFSFFTAKELLIHKVISDEEYTQYHNAYEYDECSNLYSWKITWYLDEEDQFFSQEAKPKTQQKIDENKNLRLSAQKKCLHSVTTKSVSQKNVNFQRNMSKYGLATFFFLVLFLAFSLQSEAIYRTSKKQKKSKSKKK